MSRSGPIYLLFAGGRMVIAQDPRSAVVPLGQETGRTLQVVEVADPGWQATATNGPVTTVPAAPLATFQLPDGPGTVTTSYRDDQRLFLLWLQLAAVVTGLVLAFPGLARAAEADASLSVRDTVAASGRRSR